jgi:ferredoxin-thioredoxin reductase catalytic subunit
MEKQKKKDKSKNIVCECNKCINSIEKDNKLHCKLMIIDLNKPFGVCSEVKEKIDCPYFKETR